MAIKEILQGRFMKHPLHPLLVHLPVGLWVASLVFDIVFLFNGNRNFAITSYYCILVGMLSAVVATIPGLADYSAIPKNTLPRRIATSHMLLNIAVTFLFFLNFLSRRGLGDGGAPILVTSGQFILSIFSIILLGISGYLGGLLVYNHGIGFKPQLRDRRKSDEDETRRAA